MIRRIIIAALAAIAMSAPSGAQMTGGDCCQSPHPAKQSVAISITSSGLGEHQLVAPVANQAIQVCAFSFDIGGTTPTAEFDYGTKASTDCDTNATALTGAMTAAKVLSGPLDYFTVPAASPGNQLCLKLGGTTPTAVGVLTYVQK